MDLIWSSNPDLVSNVPVDTFRDITDHSVVTATTSFSFANIVEEVFLLLFLFHLMDISCSISRKTGTRYASSGKLTRVSLMDIPSTQWSDRRVGWPNITVFLHMPTQE
jgi:hypothetical protein